MDLYIGPQLRRPKTLPSEAICHPALKRTPQEKTASLSNAIRIYMCTSTHIFTYIYIYIHVYIYIERERSDCIYVFADAMVVSVSGPWPCSCYVRDLIEIRTIHNNTRQTIKPIYKYIAKQINTYETCAQDHVLHDIHIYIYIYYISADPFRFESVGYPFHQHIDIPPKCSPRVTKWTP